MPLGLLWSTLLLPICGYISDRIGRNTLLLYTCMTIILFTNLLFHLLRYENNMILLAFMLIYQTLIAFLAACYPSMLAELFPTKVRYSGIAFCYNISFAIAGLMPLFISYLLNLTHKPLLASLFLSVLAFSTLFTSTRIQDRTRSVLL